MPPTPTIACAVVVRSPMSRVTALKIAGGRGENSVGLNLESPPLAVGLKVHIRSVWGSYLKMPISRSHFHFLNLFFIYFYLFGHAKSWLWHVGSNSPTRDPARVPCIVSVES